MEFNLLESEWSVKYSLEIFDCMLSNNLFIAYCKIICYPELIMFQPPYLSDSVSVTLREDDSPCILQLTRNFALEIH